ncbi:hypothetical protein BJY52DRAFT_1418562 [Lactarius psammicola]|nr:hypothetical protein BJY52DRAFT_1418562 [Lactarius psammicola]
MGQQSPPLQRLASSLNALAMARYTLVATYVVCYYDWVISLDQEVAFIYPAPWNLVKASYLFCRYYPLAIAPFHLWGLVGDHEQRVCESYYHALFACATPTVLSAQFILMLRTHAFSGRKKKVLAVLSVTFFGLVGVIIWVTSKELSLWRVFVITKRSGCFAISDAPTFGRAQATSAGQGTRTVRAPNAYHLGMISIFTTFFDCLNMFVVVRHCVQYGTLGPLGQSFLNQGMLVYVVMTALNALSIGTYFSPYLKHQGFGSNFSLAYILPSVLSCRLVLMLRRKASPTETELRVEHSHMVNEALEMIAVERHPEDISEGFVPSISTDEESQL